MKVKEICYSITDGSHNPPQGIEESKYLMLSSKNIFDDEITVDDPRFLTEDDFRQEDKRTRIVPGDVLLTIVGTVGRSAVVPNDIPRFTLQRSVAVLHPRNDICLSRFLMYALRSRRDYIEKTAKGVAQKGIYLGEVGEIELPTPSMEQQKSIVSILDKVGLVVQYRQRQLRILDTLIKARFVEMFGEPISNNKNLPIQRLGEICELQAGDFTPADSIHEMPDESNPYPCYGGNGIRGYVDNYTQEGDFPIIGRQGALCGNVQFAQGKFRNTEHAVLVTPRVAMNRIWLFELLCLEDLYRFHTGAAQPGLAVKTLNLVSIPVASIEFQQQYANFYLQIDKLKVVVQEALNKAQLLFDSLMQQYFG